MYAGLANAEPFGHRLLRRAVCKTQAYHFRRIARPAVNQRVQVAQQQRQAGIVIGAGRQGEAFVALAQGIQGEARLHEGRLVGIGQALVGLPAGRAHRDGDAGIPALLGFGVLDQSGAQGDGSRQCLPGMRQGELETIAAEAFGAAAMALCQGRQAVVQPPIEPGAIADAARFDHVTGQHRDPRKASVCLGHGALLEETPLV